jgi:RNA polymerase sigma-70 factor, ECF subfamily
MNETALMQTVSLQGPDRECMAAELGPMKGTAPSGTTPQNAGTLQATELAATRFRALVDTHFDFIWRSLRGLGVSAHAVDDAAQQVFLVLAQKLETIAPGRERAFLFGTALGVAANARRSQARKREISGTDQLDTVADPAPDAERLLAMKQERALLEQMLEAMPGDLRAVFVLFVLEGVSTSEISELLGVRPGTVASRLRRGREAFREIAKRMQARSANFVAASNARGKGPAQ